MGVGAGAFIRRRGRTDSPARPAAEGSQGWELAPSVCAATSGVFPEVARKLRYCGELPLQEQGSRAATAAYNAKSRLCLVSMTGPLRASPAGSLPSPGKATDVWYSELQKRPSLPPSRPAAAPGPFAAAVTWQQLGRAWSKAGVVFAKALITFLGESPRGPSISYCTARAPEPGFGGRTVLPARRPAARSMPEMACHWK